MRARILPALALLLAPFLAAGAAGAQPAQPLDRLLPQIRRDHPGQFLDAQGFDAGGNPHYHLKWLTPDGRVMWLDTDARTGRVLSQSPGRDRFDGPRPGGAAPERDPGDERLDGVRSDRPYYYRSQPDQRFDNRRAPAPGYGRSPGNGRFGARPSGQGPGGGNHGNHGGGGGHGRGGR